MSCSFLLVCAKYVRTQELQVHQPRLWNSVMPPLADSPRCNVAHFGNRRRAAKVINDFVRVHAKHLSRLRLELQAN